MTAQEIRARFTGPVTAAPLDPEPFLLCIEATRPGLRLDEWIRANRAQLGEELDRHAALLFRGFAVDSPEEFGAAARAFSPELLDYLERAAPRTEIADKVFTSTELSQDQWIAFHHEMSYSHNWPGKLYFYGDRPSRTGGATPVASERAVFPRIPAELRERFQRHGVCYVRNYSPVLDIPWQVVFQTTDRAEVEAYCRASHTEFEWVGEDGLRTRAVRQAVSRHPRTGETVWFNHAHLWHVSALQPEVAEYLLGAYGPEGVPRNAFYGDGTPIEDEAVALIGKLYEDSAVSFPWQRGDVLVVDNHLATHAREPFRGDRRILVAMSDLQVNQDLG
ncbi:MULTISPECIES: TauD/TfdA family dioxygenase [unclassified Streptomyces]|uniref:TauD/TfdA family dioxygenase n=1 Tax=unclassified Streptomyces TaxID=2593676 RepID=UPI0022547514|nr:TauD/TfdA family dioxygenase [Streptomyces sp. NBC_00555]MCX5016026.1 TauD/TfdA family dioxygenase [Streptomyces sp. NBC_00555]